MNNNGGMALNHKSRKLIYNFISNNPGTAFENIKRFLDMNKSTLNYHLKYLERSDQVTSKIEDGQRCYFCAYTMNHEIQPILKMTQTNLTEIQRQLLILIQQKPGVTNKELIFQTKLNRKSLGYNIKRLREQKLIWATKEDGTLGYEYITKDKLRHEMATRLISKLLSDEIDEQTYHKIKGKLETLNLDELMK